MDNINISKVSNIQDNGLGTYNMVKVNSFGKMGLILKEFFIKDTKNLANLNGLMAHLIRVNLKIINYKEKENSLMKIVDIIMGNGNKI